MKVMLNESSPFEGAKVLKAENGPFNTLYDLTEAISRLTPDMMPMVFEAGETLASVAEGHFYGGNAVIELSPEAEPIPSGVFVDLTNEECGADTPDKARRIGLDIRLGGKAVRIGRMELVEISPEGEDPMQFVRVVAQDTGRRIKDTGVIKGRPKTAGELLTAARTSGKSLKGMPQYWVAYPPEGGRVVGYPTAVFRKGNFLKIHLAPYDDDAKGEDTSFARTVSMLSRQPQDLEMVIEMRGESYEIDVAGFKVGIGFVAELRPWGEIDEAERLRDEFLDLY